MSVSSPGQPPHNGPQGPNPPAYLQLAPAPQHEQTAPQRNGWAVACLICGLVGILGFPILLCWIFGCVALFQIARTGQSGRLLVRLGVAASGIWILIILAKAAELTPTT
ncbi:hypothetical protein SAMN05216188_11398 [Lentzea xinjiangensis]|uniref:DUF4190 domain-containing protein n=1 Tax=Lentzea xinjiangensis TaxID=402600 RepID=A0A1H9QMA1_9PSEU|nr:DUF4190 domain-containing protein [Lentzea xinjiangensis]SER61335.1 hypothetical protein SAMN05216188_11398 [Lentzea xinjiangensis]